NLREGLRDINQGRWFDRIELEQIEQIRSGYDRQRADVVVIKSHAQRHEIDGWYRTLWVVCARIRQGNEIVERLSKPGTPYKFPQDKLDALRGFVEGRISRGLDIIRK